MEPFRSSAWELLYKNGYTGKGSRGRQHKDYLIRMGITGYNLKKPKKFKELSLRIEDSIFKKMNWDPFQGYFYEFTNKIGEIVIYQDERGFTFTNDAKNPKYFKVAMPLPPEYERILGGINMRPILVYDHKEIRYQKETIVFNIH